MSGGGLLVLAGNNTYSGRTTITSGTVALAHRLALQDSTVNVSMSGTLGFSAGITSPSWEVWRMPATSSWRPPPPSR